MTKQCQLIVVVVVVVVVGIVVVVVVVVVVLSSFKHCKSSQKFTTDVAIRIKTMDCNWYIFHSGQPL